MYLYWMKIKKRKSVSLSNKSHLGTERKAADYAVEIDETNTVKNRNPTEDKKTGFETYYPSVAWEGVTIDEEKCENGKWNTFIHDI